MQTAYLKNTERWNPVFSTCASCRKETCSNSETNLFPKRMQSRASDLRIRTTTWSGLNVRRYGDLYEFGLDRKGRSIKHSRRRFIDRCYTRSSSPAPRRNARSFPTEQRLRTRFFRAVGPERNGVDWFGSVWKQEVVLTSNRLCLYTVAADSSTERRSQTTSAVLSINFCIWHCSPTTNTRYGASKPRLTTGGSRSLSAQ
jgi:hypothetical protein